jgi:hypothetical protein
MNYANFSFANKKMAKNIVMSNITGVTLWMIKNILCTGLLILNNPPLTNKEIIKIPVRIITMITMFFAFTCFNSPVNNNIKKNTVPIAKNLCKLKIYAFKGLPLLASHIPLTIVKNIKMPDIIILRVILIYYSIDIC